MTMMNVMIKGTCSIPCIIQQMMTMMTRRRMHMHMLLLLIPVVLILMLPGKRLSIAAAEGMDDPSAAYEDDFMLKDKDDVDKDDVEEAAFDDFLLACGDGELIAVKEFLKINPSFATRDDEGETCLHAATGHAEIIKAVLDAGGDPNHMTPVEDDEGNLLQLHPLSWHVLEGMHASTKALLQGGADPNVPIGSLTQPDTMETVLDIVLGLLRSESQGEDNPEDIDVEPYHDLKDLLVEFGAKRYQDLEINTRSGDEL
jgi:ankyrin repeat protein